MQPRYLYKLMLVYVLCLKKRNWERLQLKSKTRQENTHRKQKVRIQRMENELRQLVVVPKAADSSPVEYHGPNGLYSFRHTHCFTLLLSSPYSQAYYLFRGSVGKRPTTQHEIPHTISVVGQDNARVPECSNDFCWLSMASVAKRNLKQ